MKRNWLDWLVLAVSVLLILCILFILGREALESRGVPPNIEVTLGEPLKLSAGFGVPALVRNDGDTTAEQVRLEAVLERDGKIVEKANGSLQYVPRGSRRKIWFTFENDPRAGTIRARATSYETP